MTDFGTTVDVPTEGIFRSNACAQLFWVNKKSCILCKVGVEVTWY